MTYKGNVLVVGGGIAGMAAAIMFRQGGAAVDLVDLDPEWRVYGAGITITGPTLRAFKQIGILDRVVSEGYTADGLVVCDVNGNPMHKIDTPRLDNGTCPGAGGILRPTLHKIMSERVLSVGANVKLGTTVDALDEQSNGVHVSFADGSKGFYNLVIGADGIFSRVRNLVFPETVKPRFTGQACWRLMLERPSSIDRRHFYLGGSVKIGLNPVSVDEMYMFLLHQCSEKLRFDDDTLYLELKKLMQGYGGVLAEIRESLSAQSRIVYRPLEGILVPKPWYKGHIVLIGDAAHATTPQLASGAGLAVEDAIVLCDEVGKYSEISLALKGFMERRFERCRMVVENSLELGRLEVTRAPVPIHTHLVESSLQALELPI